MNWVCEFTEDAEQDLRRLPKSIQKRVARVLTLMASDPFQGNVKALKGEEWKGVFRRRIGDYRLLFTADGTKKIVFIQQVSLRSEKTYRKGNGWGGWWDLKPRHPLIIRKLFILGNGKIDQSCRSAIWTHVIHTRVATTTQHRRGVAIRVLVNEILS